MSGRDSSVKSATSLEERLAKLERLVVVQAEEIHGLREENKRLRRENRRLRERVEELEKGLHSQNSSMPPSSDLPWTAPVRIRKPRSGRKPGGQPGHEPHQRVLVPVESLAAPPVDVKPDACRGCGTRLRGVDPYPIRHQVTDLPPRIEPYVTEHRLHTLECTSCGLATTADFPQGITGSTFGPRLVAMVAILTGQYRLSHRLMVNAAKDLFGIDMSLGSVTFCQRRASVALAAPVEEARAYVRSQSIKQADETSWAEGAARTRVWLWVAHTSLVSVFLIHYSRGAEAAREILGHAFGYLVTDRWKGYDWWPLRYRQVCWAHLKRQFKGFVDLGGSPARIGEKLGDQVRDLFALWHRVRDGTVQRTSFPVLVSPIRVRIKQLLTEGTRCRSKKVAGRCRAILKLYSALWTFVRHEGIEPTNNNSERTIRKGVIWRKLSFGSHSAEGSRFVERMLTVTASLRQQGRHVADFVTDAITRHQAGMLQVSLLPETPAT